MALNQETLFKLNFKLLDLGGVIKKVSNYFLHHSTYTAIRRNVNLNGSGLESRNVHILALGPSLKNVDLNKIEGDTLVVNRFYKMGQLYPEFVPTYYMMIDYQFGKEENKKDFHLALDTYLNKGTIFLLNSKLKGSSLLDGYPQENIYFFSSFGGDIHPEKHYKLDGILPAFQNVVGSAIMILSLMDYKKITLLGCDFNSFASTERVHCYKDESSERFMRMSWELYAYSIVAHQYDDLQQYALNNSFDIINSTKGSLIDAFPFDIDESLYVNVNKEV